MGELGEQCVICFRDRMSKPAAIDSLDFKIFVETPLPACLNFIFCILAFISPVVSSLIYYGE